MPPSRRALQRTEQGAMLIQVAIMILLLMGFSVFVIDYGVVWVARAQAQNAADAGALSGAIARAYDDRGESPPEGGVAWNAATGAARSNPIWGVPGVARPSWGCPIVGDAAIQGRCVRVDVYRNGEWNSPRLPVFFGPVFGIRTQGVRATATARIAAGNAVTCMRPWALADRWLEAINSPSPELNRWIRVGNTAVLANPRDEYIPPTPGGPGTGYRLPNDFGREIAMQNGNPDSNEDPILPHTFLPVALPNGEGGYGTGPAEMVNAIGTCVDQLVRIGDYLPLEHGERTGETRQGFARLRAEDPTATWDAGSRSVANSCAPSRECGALSPRVVPLPVFDVDDFQFHRAGGRNPGEPGPWSHCPNGRRCIKVVNIVGFFAERMNNSDVVGYLLTYPGLLSSGTPRVYDTASFLVKVQLIR